MQKIILFLLLHSLPLFVCAKLKKTTLSEALANKEVTLNAVNFEGRYNGKTTRLSIKNDSKNDLQIEVDLGMILKPDDQENQPMVLSGGENLMVSVGNTRSADVMTFCGNAPKSCPQKDAIYSFWRMGSDTLRQVLQFIKTNNLYGSSYTGQDAVWVITNGHSANSIYGSDEVSKKLRDMLCKFTGENLPGYYAVAKHVEEPGEAAYVPKALKIIAEFKVRLEEPKTMTLGVFDSKDSMIQEVFVDKDFPRSGHIFEVEFESYDVPAGKYYIRLKEHALVLQERMVEVH